MKLSWKYASDLSDRQWRILSQVLPQRKLRGRKPIHRRRVLDAVLYVVRSGCQWRMLPREFPCWSTVYGIFWRWRKDGTWQRIHDRLRGKVRRAAGKKHQPTAAILDSQSIRTAEGGEERGYDGGKKITGRKRHVAVDTLGMLLSVVVHGAYWQDHDGACFVLARMRDTCAKLKTVFADSAYGRNELPQWVHNQFGWRLQTVPRPQGSKAFVVLPKRWIVERTFAWIIRHRRNARDYERTVASSESMIYLAMIGLMTKRLANRTN